MAVPTPNASAVTAVQAFIQNWLLIFGSPMRLLSDQGLCFEANEFQLMCQHWRVAKIRTTSYHPGGNGICERVNQTIKRGLQKLAYEKRDADWDLLLPHVIYSYNTTVHSSTGFTPYYLTFGRGARMLGELLFGLPEDFYNNNTRTIASKQYSKLDSAMRFARDTLNNAQCRSKDRYDLGAVEHAFHVGDYVRIRVPDIHIKPGSKLASPWSSLHEITNIRGVVVTLRN